MLKGSVLGSLEQGSCWDTDLHTRLGNSGVSEQVTGAQCAHESDCPLGGDPEHDEGVSSKLPDSKKIKSVLGVREGAVFTSGLKK